MEKSWSKNFALFALWWMLLGAVGIVALAFRMVKTSNLSQTFRVEDIPFLDAVDQNYAALFWTLAALAVIGATLAVYLYTAKSFRLWPRRITAVLMGLVAAGFSLRAGAASSGLERPELYEANWIDWLAVFGYLAASGMAFFLFKSDAEESPPPRTRANEKRIPRAAIIYLLATAVLIVSALLEHSEFWYDHLLEIGVESPTLVSFFPMAADGRTALAASIFGEGGIAEAHLLFYTTSLLFVSLMSSICVIGYGVFKRFVTRRSEREGFDLRAQRIAGLCFGIAWAAVLGVPWLTKLWPEISKEEAWLFPVAIVGVLISAMSLLNFATLNIMASDFTPEDGKPAKWRVSDLGFVAFSLSMLYPILRMALPLQDGKRRGGSLALVFFWAQSAIVMVGLAILMAYVADWFDFDDWRDMLKRAQFPTMRVAFTMASVWAIYSIAGMALRAFIGREKSGEEEGSPTPAARPWLGLSARWVLIGSALFIGVASSFPFWGNDAISENTHARAIEFSDRHSFEVQFLHSLFDFDRDGYSAILHGSDPDDFDADVQGFGLPSIGIVPLEVPEVEVVDQEKAKNFPNVVLLYLEGFTPGSINLYGHRTIAPGYAHLPEDFTRPDLVEMHPGMRSPTPFMDDIGLRGTAFAHCRTVYPSTWDGWMQTQSGKHMMVTEFSESLLNNNHYSRYNLIDKTMRAVGINRFCYANSSPYTTLFVNKEFHQEDYLHDLDVDVSEKEEEQDIWEGDKQTDRIVDFIESLRDDDRFFIAEHMEDGHFPWNETEDARVREIGKEVDYHYAGTFDWVEKDGLSLSHDGFLHEVTRIDSQIGRITNALKKKGVWDNSIVIILGDHGCQWYEHRHRYYVSYLYEQAITAPFFLKVPGMAPQTIVKDQVQQSDLAPTLMELAGVKLTNADAYKPDGVSLVPYLKGEVSEAHHQKVDKRSMVIKTHYDKVGYIHEGRYKLITDRPFGTVRLFDLKNDPKELHNLADEKPELVKELTERMAKMAKDKMPLLLGVTPPE